VRVDREDGGRRLQDAGAVRCGGLDGLHGDLAAGAGLVLDHGGLGKVARQLLRDAPADGVGRAAGGKAGDDLGVFQLGLRKGGLAQACQECRCASGLQDLATREGHGVCLRKGNEEKGSRESRCS
jgi:hypothetical protein